MADGTSKLTVLITGASSGIGLELARLFARDGMNLILVARRLDRLDSLAEELRSRHHVQVTTLVQDLAQPDASDALFQAVQSQGLTVDILVNNAGFATFGHFAETETAEELKMLQVNIVALTHLTKLFLPGMLARRKGRILNVASTAAFQPGPLMAVYYASKAYVLHFSEAIANEVQGTGVTVSALCPGPTITEFQEVAKMEKVRLLESKMLVDVKTVAAEGYRGLMAGETIIIPGLANRLLSFTTRFAPRSMVTRIARRMQEKSD